MFNDSGSAEELSAQCLAQGLATLPSLPDSSLQMQSPGLTSDLVQIRVCFVTGSSVDSNAQLLLFFNYFILYYSWASMVAYTGKNPPAVREVWVQSPD